MSSLSVPRGTPVSGVAASVALVDRAGSNNGADNVFLSTFMLVDWIMGTLPIGRGSGGVLLVLAPGISCTNEDVTLSGDPARAMVPLLRIPPMAATIRTTTPVGRPNAPATPVRPLGPCPLAFRLPFPSGSVDRHTRFPHHRHCPRAALLCRCRMVRFPRLCCMAPAHRCISHQQARSHRTPVSTGAAPRSSLMLSPGLPLPATPRRPPPRPARPLPARLSAAGRPAPPLATTPPPPRRPHWAQFISYTPGGRQSGAADAAV